MQSGDGELESVYLLEFSYSLLDRLSLKIITMHPLIFVALICAVAASPAFESNQRYCKVVTKLVTFAKAQQAATAYCSSYLSIPPATPTTTSM